MNGNEPAPLTGEAKDEHERAAAAAHRLSIEDLMPERDGVAGVTSTQKVAMDNAHKEAMVQRRSLIHSGVNKRDLAASAKRALAKALALDDEAGLERAVALGEKAEIYTDEAMLRARDRLEVMKRRPAHPPGVAPRGIKFDNATAGGEEGDHHAAPAKPKTALRSALKTPKPAPGTLGRTLSAAAHQALEGWLLVNLKATGRVVPRYFTLDPKRLSISFTDDRFRPEAPAETPWEEEIGAGADRVLTLKVMDEEEDAAKYADMKLLRLNDLESRHVQMPPGADLSRGVLRITDAVGEVWHLAGISELHLPDLPPPVANPQTATGALDGSGGVGDDPSLLVPIDAWWDTLNSLMEHDKYLEALRTARPAQLCYRGPNPMNWNKSMLDDVPLHVVADPSMDLMLLEMNSLTTFPHNLTRLTCLTELWLGHNHIRTVDPEPLVAMTCLELLSLSCNEIEELPTTLSCCTELQQLICAANRLTGFKEGTLGGLENLVHLQLPYNQLESLPEDLGSLPSLRTLFANNNRIARLPERCDGLTSLEVLHLHNNCLGALTTGISSLCSLEVLWASYNSIVELPPGLEHCTSLTEIKLSHNALDDLREPDRGILKLPGLTRLHIHRNRLLEVPDRESLHQESGVADIGDLTSLTDLRLEGNRINWIPRRIQHLTRLESLDMSSNQLIELPVELGRLVNLREVRIEGNPWEHAFLHEVSRQPMDAIVKHFKDYMSQDVSARGLRVVPERVIQLGHLQMLKLSFNKIQSLPSTMTTLAELQILIADHNEIFQVEPWIQHLTSLHELALDYNRLMSVPRELSRLPSLTTLTLEKNSISTLPMELGRIATLKTLRLEKNLLRPPVSDAFEEDGMHGVLRLLRDRAPPKSRGTTPVLVGPGNPTGKVPIR
eukprot:CAMPEP_0114128866 /NCGR_PEP_ID=MMETSP0043_2-20121206/11168_1 /TAXON_ID=464988 /ORGANISM="Hemiselmis andersenii, Strain CCMP644" /LENGTH=895 /DNA_ID=CAMNT_0001222099 /DNA_START=69 /DNA_END=2756 /DNA_ORIENTATION=-